MVFLGGLSGFALGLAWARYIATLLYQVRGMLRVSRQSEFVSVNDPLNRRPATGTPGICTRIPGAGELAPDRPASRPEECLALPRSTQGHRLVDGQRS
jgi:hypothetical protein